MEFSLGSEKFVATRYKLREWIKLESIREDIVDAIETKDIDKLANSLCVYVSIASNKSVSELLELPWYEITRAFQIIESENQITQDFALFRQSKKQKENIPWDYPGRNWYWWSHALASKYGWSLEYIAMLDIDDAIGLLQEILIDDQIQKEWQWSLTEIAYPYNAATKQSNFKPLQRPMWMLPKPEDADKNLPVFKMRKDMLPLGIITRGNGETYIN